MTSQEIYDLGFAILVRELSGGIGHFQFNNQIVHVPLLQIKNYLHKLDGKQLVRIEHLERLNGRI